MSLIVFFPSFIFKIFGCRVRAYLRTRRGNLLTNRKSAHPHEKEVTKSTDKIRIKKGCTGCWNLSLYNFEFRPFFYEKISLQL